MTKDQKIQGVATATTTGAAHTKIAANASKGNASMHTITTDPLLETLKATSGLAQTAEPLVLKPEWEIKDKDTDESRVRKFVFTFDEDANKLSLHVNNALYREFDCKDNLNASIKFHEALDKMISCFNTWRIYERN
jgi:hypothetical protein